LVDTGDGEAGDGAAVETVVPLLDGEGLKEAVVAGATTVVGVVEVDVTTVAETTVVEGVLEGVVDTTEDAGDLVEDEVETEPVAAPVGTVRVTPFDAQSDSATSSAFS